MTEHPRFPIVSGLGSNPAEDGAPWWLVYDRSKLLETTWWIVPRIIGGRMKVLWRYVDSLHGRPTIERLHGRLFAYLRAIARVAKAYADVQ